MSVSSVEPVQIAACHPALRRLPIPAAEPRPALRLVRDPQPGALPGQESLALTVRGPGRPAHPGPARHARDPLPDPRSWAAQFVQIALEVAAGFRPLGQVVRWTSPEVFEALDRRHRLAAAASRDARRRPVIRVRAVQLFSPRSGVVEAGAVVDDGRRTRAVALRLESEAGRWRVTAWETG